MQLTENFSVHEFLKNSHGFELMPNDYDIKNLTKLCKDVMQPLRNYLQCPVYITSGVRSEGLNAMVGGKTSSYHLTGHACDFQVREPFTLIKAFDHIYRFLEFDKVIYYNLDLVEGRFIHVQIPKENRPPRKEVLICELGKFWAMDHWLKLAFGV